MTKTFGNYRDLANALLDATLAHLPALFQAKRGYSNQSCSSYLTICIEAIDEDGDDYLETFKLRFSDHADRYGSDRTIRVDRDAETVEVDDELFVTIEDWKFDDLVVEAVAAVITWINAVKSTEGRDA